MNQEDKDLQELLSNFDPNLASEVDFMARLQSRMDSVDLVKEQIAIERRRNRLSVVIAALCGSLVGVFFSLAFPFLLSTLKPLIFFGIIAALTIASALGTYHLCQILVFSTKKRKFVA